MKDDGEWRCRYGGKRKSNGNCENSAEDGLPSQCVGPWVVEKHEHIRRYIEATREVRKKFLPPPATRGGAAFVDLFAGPGRVRLRDQPDTVPGSPLIALEHVDAAFSHLIFCDLEPENVAALRARTKAAVNRVTLLEGDCNAEIDRIARRIPAHGLNIALIDPFNPSTFKWATIERIGQFKRMDLLIHFPTGPVKRNFLNPTAPDFDKTIDEMLGTTAWRKTVRSADQVPQLIDYLRLQLGGLGYDKTRVKSLAVTNEKNATLYHLVFASKSPRGTAIWKSITQHDGPQRGLPF